MPRSKVSEILPRLFQGGYPPTGGYLEKSGVKTLALCAAELQTPASEFPGVSVIHCPMNDNYEPFPAAQVQLMRKVAKRLAQEVLSGHKVLVTCAMGINRSGVVTALTVRELTGMSGAQAVALIRRKRTEALTNPAFVKWLEKIPPKQITMAQLRKRLD